MSTACDFCQILEGAAGAHRVYEDETTLAFLDRNPLAIGHVLLIPRLHVATVWDAVPETLAALGVTTGKLAGAVKRAFKADGVFVAQNNVVSQSVPHLHVHLVPRFTGDGLFARGSMVWRRVRYQDNAQREETAQRIRSAL